MMVVFAEDFPSPSELVFEVDPMRLPRVQFTLKALMIVIAIAAIWFFIIAQSIVYRYLINQSAWDLYK
jgi:hypothetical protein